MNRSEQNEKLYKRAYDGIKISSELKERLMNMKNNEKKTGNHRKWIAAVAVVVLLSCTSVYASERTGFFKGLFADDITSGVEEYVESSDENGVYQAEILGYSVTVEHFMYNEATDYGVVQFTVVDKTGKGRKWYNTAVLDEYYADWEMPQAQEGYANLLGFMVSDGARFYDDRLFTVAIDENTAVCQMTFKSMDEVVMKDRPPQIIVYEIDGGRRSEIMRLDIPMGTSLPSYCWRTAEGELRLRLSSVDYLLKDAPDSSEVSVQMKDGDSYVILSGSEKIYHRFFGTLTEAGLWCCFDRVIDLNNVSSFTVNEEVFNIEDAVIE